ncbi:two-partner secretion domain-containing protein [Achromobacter aloeverae]
MKRLSPSFAQRNFVQAGRRPLPPRQASLPALTTLAMVIGSLASGGAHANPTGGNVVAGSATINNQGNGTLNVNQSSGKAIINWKDFNIGAGETVNFRQPGSKSVTLNRVVGNDPSAIFGQLNANGTVMLVNPNGVVFGKSARVDVGGLVATTANIRDEDFLAGRYKFNQASAKTNAMVVNEGQISIKDSGLAALVAPAVRNSGVIEAKLGHVALAGARTFTVDFQGDGLLSFDASSVVSDAPKDANGKAVGALVANTGVIRADGGTVLMTARAVKDVVDNVINTDGIVSARSVGTRNGKIVLSGGDAGTVNVAGTLDASGANAGEQGGKVVVTGQHVNVAGGAAIDASGAAGGGEIALGSQGVAPGDGSAAYGNKSATLAVAAGATLKADALDRGKGGNVTLWSTDSTSFAGTISARGGANGGDGGFAEVSAEKNINLTGSADLRAPKGAAGTLLIDPETIEITDSSAPTNTGAVDNVVSRGWLEGQAGNANLTLAATGQITIDSMAAGLIMLQTTSGTTFTLSSTATGGIRFVDPETEIRTQGGNIVLQALGVGSTLDNIGKLSSLGGNITLSASGNINLANRIDAGNGAVNVATTAGSIYNTGAAAQVVAGRSVKLDAEGANVGAAGAAVNTDTGVLSILSGGDIVVANGRALSSLAIASRHAMTGKTNIYQVASPGLAFDVTDGGSYALTTIVQPGLNLSFTGDRSIVAGTVDVGTGALALTSTAGSITGGTNAPLVAGALTLQAATAIGAASQALNTTTNSLTATAAGGGINVGNTGALNLGNVNATGNVTIGAGGNLYLGGAFNAGAQTVLASALGDIDAAAASVIRTGALTLNGQNAGGMRTLNTTASTLNGAVAGKLDVASSAASLTAGDVSSQHGDISITGSGVLLANSVTSGGGAISLKGQAISVGGEINAGAGSVALSSDTSIQGTGASLITGAHVALYAPVMANSSSGTPTYTIGTVANMLRTAAGELTATGGSIYVNQVGGPLRLESLTAYKDITLTAAGGVTVNQIDAGIGRLALTAGGDILAAVPENLLAGDSLYLSAQGRIGDAAGHVRTRTDTLTLVDSGDIYLDNVDKTLASLGITNSHPVAGVPNVLQITSPYLAFDVQDDGAVYRFNQVYSAPLTYFGFQGDEGMVLGNIRGGGLVSFTATQGNITDDGDSMTRVTASSVTLAANQGSIGTAADAIDTNASSLALTTRGDLYAGSIADLSILSVTALHSGLDDVHTLQVQAPSLLFKVLDGTSGHTLSQVSDTSSLNFSFTSDRDITVGSVNTTSSGSVTLTSNNGSIKDDGDKGTVLVANSVSLNAYGASGAVGAAGGDHLDVMAGSLNAQASGGGIYIQLPSPTGSSNYTGTVNLGSIYAYNGNVVIDAVQGNLALTGTLYGMNGGITLTAEHGSILNGNGYGMIYANGNDVVLSAADAIGGADVAVSIYQSPDAGRRGILFNGANPLSITARAAGGDVYLSTLGSGGNVTLADLSAAGTVQYQQATGDTVVGSVAGGTQVRLTSTAGAILDDGDAATAISAPVVALTARGAIGAVGDALTLNAPDVALSSGGDIAVDNTTGFTRLDIVKTGYGAGQYAITAPNLGAFTLTEDGGAYYLTQIASSGDLDFGFTGYNKAIRVGSIDAGSGGAVRLGTNGDIVNDDAENPGMITAATVALSSGYGAIGSANVDVLSPLSLVGTRALSLSGAGNMYVASDTRLGSLAISAGNTSAVQHTFAIAAGDQTYTLSEGGTYFLLSEISGTGLDDFSFSAGKSIQAGVITAGNSVSLTTTGGSELTSSITSAAGGLITAPKVVLTAYGQESVGFPNAATGAIGSGSSSLFVKTSDLSIANNGSVNIDNGGAALSSLSLDYTQRYSGGVVFPSYVFNGLGSGQSLSMSYSGGSLAVGAALAGVDFSLAVDSSISVGNIDTGAAGSVSLTARSAAHGVVGQIGGNGVISGGKVSLAATGTGGMIGANGAIHTATTDLALSSSGSVLVSNSGTLAALSLTALHDNTVAGQVNSYGISSGGDLVFSLTDNGPSSPAGMTANISTSSDLKLALSTDRALTLDLVKTGSGGSVDLTTTQTIYGTHTGTAGTLPGGPDIVTGDLTLNANSVQGRYIEAPAQPLYISANTLSSNVTQSLWVSNDKTLTLLDNSAGNSATVAVTSGDIQQSGSGRFVTPVLSLSAAGSIGADGAAVLTDTRQLTASSGGDLVLDNASDLFRLDLNSTHAAALNPNVLRVVAKGLDFEVTDNGEYVLSKVTDSTGLDFAFSGDRNLRVGVLDTGPAQSVSLSSSGSILNIDASGEDHIAAGQISLTAGASIGAIGNSIDTVTGALSLTAGANIYVANDGDLSTLSITSTAQSAMPTQYGISADRLTFNVGDDGVDYLINQVADATGLNFSFRSQRGQQVGSIDVLHTGTVTLTSSADIMAASSGAANVVAGKVALNTVGAQGNIGAAGSSIVVDAPLLSVWNAGDVYVSDQTHVDALTVDARGTSARTYDIDAPLRDRSGQLTFNVTDDGSGMVVHDIADAGGIALSVSSDRGMTVGAIDAGFDNVGLNAINSALVGDGDDATRIVAARLTLTGDTSIGATGNEIDTDVDTLSATSRDGGIQIALNGNTTMNGFIANGDSALSNSAGDIALGTIFLAGHSFSMDNQGGSILSGTINGATSVSLSAAGSIGNVSAIRTTALGNGTTTVTLSAQAAHGADGSIALTEDYGLAVTSAQAPGDIVLTAGQAQGNSNLTVGAITAGGDVTLTAQRGDIVGDSGNSVAGDSVTLTAAAFGHAIGASGATVNVDTDTLTINNGGNFYIHDNADLANLTINRQVADVQAASAGAMVLSAAGLSFAATDGGGTTLTTVVDSTGLNFNFTGTGDIRVGTIDAGAGSVALTAGAGNSAGSILSTGAGSLITAHDLALTTASGGGSIGAGNAANQVLNTQVAELTASSAGGIWINQTGTVSLDDVHAGGALSVAATGGDILIGQVSNGAGQDLTLSANAGSILSNGGAITTSGTGAIALSAANGIGSETAGLQLSAAFKTVSASVSGAGSLYLDILDSLTSGLTSSVHDGSTNITSAGPITLTSVTSATDAVGNDIRVSAASGDITVGVVDVGGVGGHASNGEVALTARNGNIVGATGSDIEAYRVTLNASGNVGSSGARVGVTSSRVEANSAGGDVYLNAGGGTILSFVTGNNVNVNAVGDLQIANAIASNSITVAGGGIDSVLVAGNIDAGQGSVSLAFNSVGGTIVDDGNAATRIVGGMVSLQADAGIGGATAGDARTVQTTAESLVARSNTSGPVYIDDNRADGVRLASIIAGNGAIGITTAGDTIVDNVQAQGANAGNTISIASAAGSLAIGTVSAGGGAGDVTLTAAGDIRGTDATLVTGATLTASAGGDIGRVDDLSSTDGGALRTKVSALGDLASRAGGVIAIDNSGAGTLAVGANVNPGAGGTLSIRAAGDMDASAGIAGGLGTLLLSSGGTLTLPDGGVTVAGNATLKGTTDIVAGGGTPRTIEVTADSLAFTSGSAGGDTRLETEVETLDAKLTNTSGAAKLTVANTGDLDATLSTANGDIEAATTGKLTATDVQGAGNISLSAGGTVDAVSVRATGVQRLVSVASDNGDIGIGAIDAGGVDGRISLFAQRGGIANLGSGDRLTAHSLSLIARDGIGAANSPLNIAVSEVAGAVTGDGGLYLSGGNALTVGVLTTANGDIGVTTTGDLAIQDTLVAGGGGHVGLTSTGGNVEIDRNIVATDMGSLSVSGNRITLDDVATNGAQAYHGDVLLNGNLAGGAIDVDGSLTLGGAGLPGSPRTLTATGAAGGIEVAGALDGGGYDLGLDAGAGSVTLAGPASNLAALTVTGSGNRIAGVATEGAQTYNGATTLSGTYTTANAAFTVNGAATLGGAVSIDTIGGANGAGADVRFAGTLASAAGGAHGLAVDAGTGDVAFVGAVGDGADARLGDLTVRTAGATVFKDKVYAQAVATDDPGTLALDGSLVDTTGDQYFGERAVLGGNVTLKGALVTLKQGADAATAGGQSLTIDGRARVLGAVGADQALAALTVTGPAGIRAASINTVGAQAYQGDLVLGADLALTTAAGGVLFGGSVDGAHALAVTARGGDAAFNGAVGGGIALASLTVDASNVALNGGAVKTVDEQNYNGHVTLGRDTVLTGYEVHLNDGADGAHALAIDGLGKIAGAVGSRQALSSLTVTGTAILGQGSIATSGGQSYLGRVLVAGDQQLSTQGGDISFARSVSGSHALSIAAQGGDVDFAAGAGVGGDVDPLAALTVDTSGATHFGGAVRAASLTTLGHGSVTLDNGSVVTSGAQHYDSHVVLGQDTVLKGTQVALLDGGDGAHALTIDGNATLGGAFGAGQALDALKVSGATTFNDGSIATTGGQTYAGAVTLAGDQALTSHAGDIAFGGAVDSAAAGGGSLAVQAAGDVSFDGAIGAATRAGALSVDAGGDTHFAGTIRAASLRTGPTGTLAIDSGSVDTTGDQRYGQHVVLSTDTTLTGANVALLAGVDAATTGAQGLHIAGNAAIAGNVGATAALRGLAIDGNTSTNAGTVRTVGDQVYGGAVAFNADGAGATASLASSAGSVVFGSTLDGAGSNLSIDAAHAISAAGDVTGVGALTLRAVDTIVFNGAVSAYRVQQLEAQSAVYRGKLTATGPDGIDLSGGSFAFGGDVSADAGAIKVASTDAAGTVNFAAGSTVSAATSFTQRGGATLLLPARLLARDSVELGAVGRIQGNSVAISTQGDITAIGLYGPQATATLTLGAPTLARPAGGTLKIGLNDAAPDHKLNVGVLAVPTAGSAQVYGSIGGRSGAVAAAFVTSPLAGAPYFMNDTPWGPNDVVQRVTAATAPRWVAPTKPGVDSLFRGTVSNNAYGPDALGAYADPQVLKVSSVDMALWQLPAGLNRGLNAPAADPSVLRMPEAGSTQEGGDDASSSAPGQDGA